MKQEIEAFLTPTLESVDPAKPTIPQHYALTFNSVDRINKLVGYIIFQPRLDENFLLITSLIQIAIATTWALLGDAQYDSRGPDQQGFDLRKFAYNLGTSLLE